MISLKDTVLAGMNTMTSQQCVLNSFLRLSFFPYFVSLSVADICVT